jgi:hypothetical protein
MQLLLVDIIGTLARNLWLDIDVGLAACKVGWECGLDAYEDVDWE